MVRQISSHSWRDTQTGMNGTEVVHNTCPEHLGLEARCSACQVTSAPYQGGHPGTESGIQALNVSGVDQATGRLRHGNQVRHSVPAAIVHTARDGLEALALALFVGAELLTPDPSRWGPNFALPVSVLLVPAGQNGWWVTYPVLQWVELVVFGLAFGGWLAQEPSKAFSRAWKLGGGLLVAFVVVRYLDGFGNIRPRMGNNWIDWLNPVKYPPSMTFTMMTTGLNLILLWSFSQAGERVRRFLQPLVVFGQVPLFFYALHLVLYAGLGYLVAPGGSSIPAMYPFWLLGLLILFPLCLWYGRFKHRQPANSILRFL